ncbi:MAG: very short patch repair endonuclease [Thermoleophilaceae bacterium]|nr:very short patch repair endonuclease [Thermoleophilaceae bacterium]
MRAQRTEGTAPELRLRSELHRLGLRYRVHFATPFDRRRKIDIAFPARRIAVFVDGCFWHSCPQHVVVPTSNRDFWIEKLARNRERDLDTNRRLIELGWEVIRVWEHEDPTDAAARIKAIVDLRRIA